MTVLKWRYENGVVWEHYTDAEGVERTREIAVVLGADKEANGPILGAALESRNRVDVLREVCKHMEAERDSALAALRLVKTPLRDVWKWQGDGEDRPESMSDSLAVVLSGATARRFEEFRVAIGRLLSPSWYCQANQGEEEALRTVEEMQAAVREAIEKLEVT